MRKLDQKGAVSLLSTMIFSIIVIILITAYMMTALSQQRQAVTHDFSTRAYYTAESGVQDAIRALNAGAGPSDNCTPYAGGGIVGVSSVNLEYTCQIVTEGADGAQGILAGLNTNQTVMIRLNPKDISELNPTENRLVVRWSPTTEERYSRGAQSTFTIMPPGGWNSGNTAGRPIHSLLRVNVISHPQSNLNRGNINQRVVFLNPTSAGESSVLSDYSGGQLPINTGDNLVTQQEQLINHAECYSHDSVSIPSGHAAGADTYSCRRTILLHGAEYNFANQAIYVRVSPFYRNTQMYIELTNGDGLTVDLAGEQATIDVTAKAGNNVFRRVRQVVNIGGDIVIDGTDAAVVAAEGICKHFAVGLTVGDFVPGCNPLD